MKSIILGTAGHIDHGKTALVKALTGIDADRLEEEKRRGITIDLGFAHMDLPRGKGGILRVAFVDVPGHERFVRNMLAGVGGIDLVLLVIAANESIKPQTREHFDILQLLGVQRGITVLSKADAVDAETLDVARMEVAEFLRGTFLDGSKSPIIPVSSLTGAGLEELKLAIVEAAEDVPPRDSQAVARLPIDRVFTMKGFGTVVTGTLVAGTIRREDELEIFPPRLSVRVRGIQVHGEMAEAAVAGQRTAANVAGVAADDLMRGMTLAAASTFATTRRADVRLRLLSSAPRPLKTRSRVHFHCNTMEAIAEVKLYGGELRPGEEAFARITLLEPVLILPGDRFILRQLSPVVTIGGGLVLDAAPLQRTAHWRKILGLLATREPADIPRIRIARRRTSGISMAALIAETGWTRERIERQLAPLLLRKKLLRMGDLLVHSFSVSALRELLVGLVERFHKHNPLVTGINREQLRAQAKASEEIFAGVLDLLVAGKQLEIAGDLVRLPGRNVVMKDDEAASKEKIEAAFASAGLSVPGLSEVIAGLKIDKVRAQKIVTLLLRDKVLTKVSDEMVFHRSALEELRRRIGMYKAKSTKIDVAKFKELMGVSRKYAIPLLEYLDRERVTKRMGDAREIL